MVKSNNRDYFITVNVGFKCQIGEAKITHNAVQSQLVFLADLSLALCEIKLSHCLLW